MSDLELANRTFIGLLMHNGGFRMDSTQQSLVSAWALKTTIMVESLMRRGHISSPRRRSPSSFEAYNGLYLKTASVVVRAAGGI